MCVFGYKFPISRASLTFITLSTDPCIYDCQKYKGDNYIHYLVPTQRGVSINQWKHKECSLLIHAPPNLTKTLFWLIKSTQIIKQIVPVAYFFFPTRKQFSFSKTNILYDKCQGVVRKEWKGYNQTPGMKSWILATTGTTIAVFSWQDSLFNPSL